MNVANNNNNRKNENNNNNNQNNNNNINEGIEVVLNEFQNMVTAMGTGMTMMGRDLDLHTHNNIVSLHFQSLTNAVTQQLSIQTGLQNINIEK